MNSRNHYTCIPPTCDYKMRLRGGVLYNYFLLFSANKLGCGASEKRQRRAPSVASASQSECVIMRATLISAIDKMPRLTWSCWGVVLSGSLLCSLAIVLQNYTITLESRYRYQRSKSLHFATSLNNDAIRSQHILSSFVHCNQVTEISVKKKTAYRSTFIQTN